MVVRCSSRFHFFLINKLQYVLIEFSFLVKEIFQLLRMFFLKVCSIDYCVRCWEERVGNFLVKTIRKRCGAQRMSVIYGDPMFS